MPPAQSDATALAENFCEGMPDEDRIDFALEVLLSVKDTDLHPRVEAVANAIGQHGHELARKHLPVAYPVNQDCTALAQAIARVDAETAMAGSWP